MLRSSQIKGSFTSWKSSGLYHSRIRISAPPGTNGCFKKPASATPAHQRLVHFLEALRLVPRGVPNRYPSWYKRLFRKACRRRAWLKKACKSAANATPSVCWSVFRLWSLVTSYQSLVISYHLFIITYYLLVVSLGFKVQGAEFRVQSLVIRV